MRPRHSKRDCRKEKSNIAPRYSSCLSINVYLATSTITLPWSIVFTYQLLDPISTKEDYLHKYLQTPGQQLGLLELPHRAAQSSGPSRRHCQSGPHRDLVYCFQPHLEALIERCPTHHQTTSYLAPRMTRIDTVPNNTRLCIGRPDRPC